MSEHLLKLDSLSPNPAALHEIDHLACSAIHRLNHVIVILQKELAGIQPVFAVDFEILHAFLFPTLQKATARVWPSLASFVLRNSQCNLVLPSATVTELIQFSKAAFPAIAKF